MKVGVVAAATLVLASGINLAGTAGGAIPAESAESPRDATYLVETESIRLVDGRAERPVVPGAATTIRTRVLGAPAYGDLDGDGDEDAVVLLVHDPGGSGTFYYVAAAHKIDDGYRGGPAVLIGDRIRPSRVRLVHDVVVVDYLERAPGEPMTAEPTLARSEYLMLEGDALTLSGSLDAGEQIVDGWVTIGHEVRSFEPCGGSDAYWLLGDSPALEAVADAYREVCAAARPYSPLFMVLAGGATEAPATGFGADYGQGWRVTRVLRAVAGGDCRSDRVAGKSQGRRAEIASPAEPAEPLQSDGHALWLGRRVLAVAEAIRRPNAPDAMDAVLELGLDSRYYVMVRGWLMSQLRADQSISQAGKGSVSPEVAARIAFLEKAIRAIDLE